MSSWIDMVPWGSAFPWIPTQSNQSPRPSPTGMYMDPAEVWRDTAHNRAGLYAAPTTGGRSGAAPDSAPITMSGRTGVSPSLQSAVNPQATPVGVGGQAPAATPAPAGPPPISDEEQARLVRQADMARSAQQQQDDAAAAATRGRGQTGLLGEGPVASVQQTGALYGAAVPGPAAATPAPAAPASTPAPAPARNPAPAMQSAVNPQALPARMSAAPATRQQPGLLNASQFGIAGPMQAFAPTSQLGAMALPQSWGPQTYQLAGVAQAPTTLGAPMPAPETAPRGGMSALPQASSTGFVGNWGF